ncbi:hypothetical protein RJ639_028471 [Escallonia herrerae]|uniref:DUF659 domain-containing protein n=1 Tax=Escallonia herrerae TaxID=1293975 RepID=A0AA88X715_9ASTE|nr:hypothetical protein RJ639_028471 [Escallonia herrerae]
MVVVTISMGEQVVFSGVVGNVVQWNVTDNSSSIVSAPARSDDLAWAHDDDSEDIALSANSIGKAGKKKGKEVAVASKRKKGTMFLKSIDASGLTKDTDTLYGIFNEVVQLIGPNYIVQFITEAAGKRLKRNLADVRHFPTVDGTIIKAKNITKFIDNHGFVVNMMRKEFTNGRELCRPGITRFATNILSLQCLLKFKKELR